MKRNWFMDPNTSFATAISPRTQSSERRVDRDRRAFSDRRRSGGLFDLWARRDQGGYDRRRGDRREQRRSWLSRWRRDG